MPTEAARSTGRFVIHEHHRGADVHWDLMLQSGQVLHTWRLPIPPDAISDQPVEAVRIFDHPVRFLIYEGPVQNNTGHVFRIDAGTFIVSRETPDQIELTFGGTIITGRFALVLVGRNLWSLARVEN